MLMYMIFDNVRTHIHSTHTRAYIHVLYVYIYIHVYMYIYIYTIQLKYTLCYIVVMIAFSSDTHLPRVLFNRCGCFRVVQVVLQLKGIFQNFFRLLRPTHSRTTGEAQPTFG